MTLRLRDNTVAALCGMAVMGVEMAAARLLAPWYGTSTVTWAALISTVLGSLAVGSWWGGRLATRSDRRRNSLVVASQSTLGGAQTLANLPYPPWVKKRLRQLPPPIPAPAARDAWLLTDDRAPVAWLTDWSIAARVLASR